VGLSKGNVTLGEIVGMVSKDDLVNLLISDTAQAKLLQAMKPGAVFRLNHGFLLRYLDSIGKTYPEEMDMIAVCSKGTLAV